MRTWVKVYVVVIVALFVYGSYRVFELTKVMERLQVPAVKESVVTNTAKASLPIDTQQEATLKHLPRPGRVIRRGVIEVEIDSYEEFVGLPPGGWKSLRRPSGPYRVGMPGVVEQKMKE